MKQLAYFAFSTICFFCSNLFSEPISLYVKPDTRSDALAKIDSSNEILLKSKPITDPQKANEGWQEVTYPGPFLGYIENNRVDEDSRVKNNTPVYYRPTLKSRKLATINDSDMKEFMLEGNWTRVKFDKPVTLYLLAPVSPLPIQKIPVITTENITPTVNGQSLPPATPVETPPPPTPKPQQTDTVPIQQTTPQPVPAPPPPQGAVADDIPRQIVGVLKRTRKRFGFNPPYNLQIVDKKNKRVAYVDTANLILNKPLESCLNQKVVINGKATKLKNKKKQIVIKARTLRIISSQ